MKKNKLIILMLLLAASVSAAIAVATPRVNLLTRSISAVQDEIIETEVVTATADGFAPAVITRPHGPFVLAVHNQSGDGELTLRLTDGQGVLAYEARLAAGRRRHHQRLDLPPGEYVLSEASHPAWQCRITITR